MFEDLEGLLYDTNLPTRPSLPPIRNHPQPYPHNRKGKKIINRKTITMALVPYIFDHCKHYRLVVKGVAEDPRLRKGEGKEKSRMG